MVSGLLHMSLFYSGAILGAISSGYLILKTTFSASSLRDSSIQVLGMRGPLGAFVVARGGIAMFTAAALDNWWHQAYGLDVTLLSVPHMFIAFGMRVLELGSMLLVLVSMNRERTDLGAVSTATKLVFFVLAGLQISDQLLFLIELWAPAVEHTGDLYCVVGAVLSSSLP
jgi:hypothetical protein